MPTLRTLTTSETLRRLSTPSNYRLGQEIARRGRFEWLERSPARVVAKVLPPGGTRRTTRLSAGAKKLSWSCTCTSHRARMCKHAVAVALRSRRVSSK